MELEKTFQDFNMVLGLLINPWAGSSIFRQRKINYILNLRDKYSRKFGIGFKTFFLESKNDTSLTLEQVVKAGAKRIIVCGGDGTVNFLLKYIADSDLEVAIVPIGSGNGLAKAFRIPKKISNAFEFAIKGKAKWTDVFTANEHFFVNICGVGIDGVIAHYFNENKKRGFLSYITFTFKAFHGFKPFEATLIGDTFQEVLNKNMIVAFCNGYEYGNSFKIAPPSCLDDGMLNAVIVRYPGLLSILKNIHKPFLGEINKLNFVSIIQGRSFILKTPFGVGHVDGEPVIFNQEVKICLYPQKCLFVRK